MQLSQLSLKETISIVSLSLLVHLSATCQNYPAFGPEKSVTITGLTFDAMEPFLSPSGNTLYFNNLNDGITTKLYYATLVNDSTFTYVGELNGTNQTTSPYLDAVADMDSLNIFFWTSTRNYPTELDNLFHGTISNGVVTNIGRVHGDFNMNTPGWLVMDHGVSIDGQYLYFNNARFDNANCQGACETWIGLAQKVNDSTFNTVSNSSTILQNINDPNYIYYAPCITSDHLELYYTRYLKGTITPSTLFEICVAVRNTPSDNFSAPVVLFSELISNLIEAPTFTTDKQIMYYHKKTATSHEIKMRYRSGYLGTSPTKFNNQNITIFPNPTKTETNIRFVQETGKKYSVVLYNILGVPVKSFVQPQNGTIKINRDHLNSGTYIVHLYNDSQIIASEKLIIE